MAESQPPRVEHWPLRFAGAPPAVLGVARDGMTQRRQVHANLVRPAGFEITAQECMPAPSLDHLITRTSEAAASDHRHSQPVLRMPANRSLELARVRFE